MGGRGSRALLAAASLVMVPSVLVAQVRAEPYLTLGAGNATDALGVRSAAVVVAPGVALHASPTLVFSVNGDFTRFTNDQWSVGGTGGVSGRARVAGPIAVAASANAGVTQTAHHARYMSTELLPTVEVTHERVTLFTGVRAAWGGMRLEESAPARPLPIGTPATTRVSTSASLRAALYGALVRLDGGSARGTLSAREERGHVGDSSLVDRSFSAGVDVGRVGITATAGVRHVQDVAQGYTGMGATVTARPGIALHVAAGRYAGNPLTGVAGGSYLSAGVRLSPGRPAPRSLERPPSARLRGEAPPADGMTRMTIRAPHARQVEVAGDWSSWKLVRARRAADGVHWYVDLPLARGRYRYAFRIDGARWEVPAGARAVDDGFGGKSAWVTIE